MESLNNINKSFDILGLKPATRRVLITLTEKGTSTAADIAKFLVLPKSTVYDSLSELVDKSIVVEYSTEKGKTFAIPDKEQLIRVHKKEVAELESAHAALFSFLESHTNKHQTARPKIKFYAGVEGIKQAFRDMSWEKNTKEAYLMWPLADMIESLGEDFLRNHNESRLSLGVTINCILKEVDRKLEDAKDSSKDQAFYTKLREVRYAQKSIDWQMSYWIYGNKCLFASSGTEKFAFMVQSDEFASLVQLMWKKMWDTCEK